MKTDFEFVEFEKLNLKGYTLIEGFPGMGLVGTIAAKYLVEKLNFEMAGYIDSAAFAPIIRIHNGLPIRPARFYIDNKRKIAVIISEQVIGQQYAHAVAKKTVEWIKAKGFKELVSLSGVHTEEQPGKEIIYGIAANEKSRATLEKYGLTEIKDGVTTGITALILLELKQSDINAISILGNVRLSADYKASAEVLKKLNDAMNLSIDVAPLLEEAKQTEKQLIQQLQNLKETKDNSEKFETRTPVIT